MRAVALRKESVDRNDCFRQLLSQSILSLSARRAWIEMVYLALIRYLINTSLSARRAWIEIFVSAFDVLAISVALRKESVDRNANPGSTTLTFPGSLSARRAWIDIRK